MNSEDSVYDGAASGPKPRALRDPKGADRPIVLIVDDDEGTRTLLQSVFTTAGFDVRLAEGGREGLELLATTNPEAIISDVVMPEISGYELCRRVRSAGHTDVPFLFCSGLSDPPERVEGLRLGADDYIAKPVLLEEIVLKVGALVQRGRALRALRRRATERSDNAALRGTIEEVGVPELLQLIDFIYRGDACLVLESKDGSTGRIWTLEGTLLHAEVGARVGATAFYKMLAWSSGTFRIERLKLEIEPTMSAKIATVLVSGLAYLDEYERLRGVLSQESGYFVVNEASTRPNVLSEEKRDCVLRLVDAHHDIEAMLEHSPISALDTVQALFTMLKDTTIRAGERPLA